MQLERMPHQKTMSAIGDVGVAVGEMSSRPSSMSLFTNWAGVVLFFALTYLAGRWEPILAPICAALAFWSRQRWRKRVADLEVRLASNQKALTSLGHAASTAVSAIRANLIGFRMEEAPASNSPHLSEIERALDKLRTTLG